MKELLLRYHPNLSFAEMRAAIAGAVLTVEMVQPSQLMAHLFGSEDESPQFENIDVARILVGGMMGLWNELTDHQDKKKPFLFSDWPATAPADNDELLRMALAREKEIEQFVWGLRTGNTPFADDFVEPTAESLIAWLPSMLEACLRVMKREREALEKGQSKDRLILLASHFALNEQMRERHAEFATGVRDLRSQWMEDMKQSTTRVRSEPKVGRNDPCPCGSGRSISSAAYSRLPRPPFVINWHWSGDRAKRTGPFGYFVGTFSKPTHNSLNVRTGRCPRKIGFLNSLYSLQSWLPCWCRAKTSPVNSMAVDLINEAGQRSPDSRFTFVLPIPLNATRSSNSFSCRFS